MRTKSREAALAALRERVRALEWAGGGATRGTSDRISLGDPAFDRELVWNGLPRGAVHEVAGRRGGATSGFAAALAARFAGADDGPVLWCQTTADAFESGALYGPGMARFAPPAAARLILLRCRRDRDVLWAMEEALRCPGVAAVVGEVDRVDLRASRRLQLAAEAGGTNGLLLRPRAHELAPSAALTRWRVAAAPSADGGIGPACWEVELWRCRGGAPGRWTVQWDEQAFRFSMVAVLADRSADARRPALAG